MPNHDPTESMDIFNIEGGPSTNRADFKPESPNPPNELPQYSSDTDSTRRSSYDEVSTLDELLELNESNRLFYEAMMADVEAHPGRTINIAEIGRRIGASKALASLIFNRLSPALQRLGFEVPHTKKHPLEPAQLGIYVLDAYNRQHASGESPSPRSVGIELNVSTLAVKTVMRQLGLTRDNTDHLAKVRLEIIRLREERHLPDRVIMRLTGASRGLVENVLHLERKRRLKQGDNGDSLRVRAKRRTRREIASFEERVAYYRQQHYTYQQIIEAIHGEVPGQIPTTSQVLWSVRNLIHDGKINSNTPAPSDISQAVWAIMNENPDSERQAIQQRLAAAGIKATAGQIYAAQYKYRHSDRSAYRMMSDGEFAATYEEWHDRLYVFALSRIGDREAALDIVARTFAKAYTRLPKFITNSDEQYTIKGWLFATVRYACLDYSSDKTRTELSLSALQEKGFEPMARETNMASGHQWTTDKLLGRLMEPQAFAIQLRVIENRTWDATAREMGLSLRVVRRLVSTGLVELRKLLLDVDDGQAQP